MSGRYQPAMLKYFEQFSAHNVCIVIQASMLEHKKTGQFSFQVAGNHKNIAGQKRIFEDDGDDDDDSYDFEGEIFCIV